MSITSEINNFTSPGEWLYGIWSRTKAGMSIPANATNLIAFKVGEKVEFVDGTTRTIVNVQEGTKNLGIWMDGGVLDGNKVGYPNKVKSLSTAVIEEPAMPTVAPASPAGATLPFAGLNYTGLGNNTFVINPEPGTHYRLFDERCLDAFPQCKFWRVTISLSRILLSSQGMGLDPTYVQQVTDVLDGIAKRGGVAFLDAHDWLRIWKNVERLPGFALNDKNEVYRVSDGRVVTKAEINAGDLSQVGGKYKVDGTRNVKVYFDKRVGELQTSEQHILGVKGCPRITNEDGIIHTWKSIIRQFMNHPAIWGYEFMNEPYKGPEKDPVTGADFDIHAYWIKIATRLVKECGTVDKTHKFLVGGNQYQTASAWTKYSDPLKDIPDPNNQIIYAAHYYVDDNGGAWNDVNQQVSWDAGTRPISDFLNWLKLNNKRGILTEFGGPAGNESVAKAHAHLIKAAWDANVPVVQWAAGPGWPMEDGNAVNYETATGVCAKDNVKPLELYFNCRKASYDQLT